jgi:hypothetical protein
VNQRTEITVKHIVSYRWGRIGADAVRFSHEGIYIRDFMVLWFTYYIYKTEIRKNQSELLGEPKGEPFF